MKRLREEGAPPAPKPTRAQFKAARRARATSALALSGGLAAVVTPAAPPSSYAFTVSDERDHAETPFEAYRDLEPLLFRLAAAAGKTKAGLRIYDPFFCAGSVVAHLARLGFTSVRNVNEDFYAATAPGAPPLPDFDVLVTNPPFSGDHIARTLAFAARCGKPWAILVPDFVSRKPYWPAALGLLPDAHPPSRERGPSVSPLCGPLHFLGPRAKAYLFAAPGRGLSGAPRATGGGDGADGAPRVSHVFAATFQCVWHLALEGKAGGAGGGEGGAIALARWHRKRIEPSAGSALLHEDVSALPQLALDAGKKRREESAARPWRKKLLRQRKAAAKEASGGAQRDE